MYVCSKPKIFNRTLRSSFW